MKPSSPLAASGDQTSSPVSVLSPSSPLSASSVVQSESQCQTSPGEPSKPSAGRGLLAARLKKLALDTPALPSTIDQTRASVTSPLLQETKAESLFNPILTHHEKPPVVKKGEAGRK